MALTKIDDRGLKTPIDLIDNEKIRLGTGNDLELYHSGSHSYIDHIGTGDLWLRSTPSGGDVYAVTANNGCFVIQNASGAAQFLSCSTGSTDLYYNGIKTFKTHGKGIIVQGPEGDDADILLNADEGDDNADKWRVRADSVASGFYIQNYESGSWEESIKAHGGGNVELYHNNVKTFETTSAGATIHRDLTLNHASGDTALRWAVGGTNKFSVYESSGTLRFYDNTNSAERMRIASNGKIGIGTDSPTRYLHVKETSGGDAQIIVETTANAERAQIEFKSPHGTWVTGTFGGNTTGDWLTYTAGDHDAIFHQNGSEKFRIKGDGDVEIKDGNLIIETAGHGINFHPHSGTDNLLDDYEEGTWTPAYGSSSVTASSYVNTGGHYTKIGRLVTFTGTIRMDSSTVNSNPLTLGGFPFTNANNATNRGGFFITYHDNWFSASSGETAQVTFLLSENTAYGYFYDGDGANINADDPYDGVKRPLFFCGHFYV